MPTWGKMPSGGCHVSDHILGLLVVAGLVLHDHGHCAALSSEKSKGCSAPSRQLVSKLASFDTNASQSQAWPAMRSCMKDLHLSHIENYDCRSPRYEDYYKKITQTEPLGMGQMQFPVNSRVLIFGHSYTGQLFVNLLCGSPYECDGPLRDRIFPRGSNRFFASHHCYHPAGNVSLVGVLNDPFLQTADSFGVFKQFLDTAAFDIAVYMRPHPDCLLQAWVNRTRQRRNLAPCWVEIAGEKQAERLRDSRTFTALLAKVPAVIQVLPWGNDKRQDAADTLPGAKLVVSTTPIVGLHPCAAQPHHRKPNHDQGDCYANVNEHQCLVSGITLATRQVIELAKTAKRLARLQQVS